jgi:hypothetical protein
MLKIMNKFVRFFMIVALACIVFACKSDDEQPEVYLEVAEADINLSFAGEADSKTITVSANREIEGTASESWVKISPEKKTADNSVAITITIAENTIVKKRTATITLSTVQEGKNDAAPVKVDIALSQSPLGLVTAALLDVSFNATGAVDNSPLANTIYNVLPFMASLSALDAQHQAWWDIQEYPEYKVNTAYDRYTAYFHGGQNENATSHATGARGDRGSCCLRVDYADFNNVPANYLNGSPGYLPLNKLGEALYASTGYSLECIFRPNPWGNNKYIFSSIQSSGHGFKVEGAGEAMTFSWFSETCLGVGNTDKPGYSLNGISNRKQDMAIHYLLSPEERNATDKFYHFIGTWENPSETNDNRPVMMLYLNGKIVRDSNGDGKGDWEGTSKSTGTILKLEGPRGNVLRAGTPGTNALSQWYAIGGNSRCTDHPGRAGVHWNKTTNAGTTDSGENWAEHLFSGEIVVCRIYDKALTATEANVLYNYEKTE